MAIRLLIDKKGGLRGGGWMAKKPPWSRCFDSLAPLRKGMGKEGSTQLQSLNEAIIGIKIDCLSSLCSLWPFTSQNTTAPCSFLCSYSQTKCANVRGQRTNCLQKPVIVRYRWPCICNILQEYKGGDIFIQSNLWINLKVFIWGTKCLICRLPSVLKCVVI